MDAVQMNHNWHCIEDESEELPLSPEAPGICDASRDTELLPCIGADYQIEIPPLMTQSAYHLLTQSPNDAVFSAGTPRDFSVGLPISLMWIKDEVSSSGSIDHEPRQFSGGLTSMSSGNESVKSESILGMHIFPEGDFKPEVKNCFVAPYTGTEVGQSANTFLQQEGKNEMHQKHGSRGYCLVPGSLGDGWSDLGEASFLLSLYIFGKNFVQVKKFVGSKSMGEILSFYYGKFYRSDKYRKWSECRRVRSRRCKFGQRIFTGTRQQELLSRLRPHVSEECQSSLLEVAKTFGEGKMSLEVYVFTLKAIAGLNAFVEAVGIGKGKHDLTGIVTEPQKSNQAALVRAELPSGKPCSALTPLEIVNYLTGGIRLSKARSSDLFWEAVWPRLLARGWHSEQPKDHSFAAATRHSLVFLIPGIKKFSRRKLVKGNHYFDSVSDVLNKVASDPELLELDVEADNKEENGWIDETNLDQVDSPDEQRHCYLKPRTPSRSSDVMKFTIVDTSLANEQTTNVRELRSLPAGIMNISASRSDSDESDGDSSEESTDESDDSMGHLYFDGNKTSMSKSKEMKFGKVVTSGKEDSKSDGLNQSFPVNGSGFIKVPVNIPEKQKTDKRDDIQPRRAIKGHVIRRVRPNNKKVLDPVAKRRLRLTACYPMEASCSTIDVLGPPRSKEVVMGCMSRHIDLRGDILSAVDPTEENSSSPTPSTSSRSTPNGNDKCTLSSNSFGCEDHNQKTQSRTLIDLNIPVPQDAEIEPLMMEMDERQHNVGSIPIDNPTSGRISVPVRDSISEQPSESSDMNQNSRRHSTRIRPLTTKALEALACGFLSIKTKRKSGDGFPLSNRPSRRARSRARITQEDIGTGIVDIKGDIGEDGERKSNDDVISKFQI